MISELGLEGVLSAVGLAGLTGLGLIGIAILFLVALVISVLPIWLSQKVLFEKASILTAIGQGFLLVFFNALIAVFIWSVKTLFPAWF